LLISRSGINNWSISYKDQVSFFESSDDIFERIKFLFNNLSTDYLSSFILDNAERAISISVSKVTSADRLDSLLDALDKMISIKEYSISSYKEGEISFSCIIFGTENQFIESVKTHKDFLLEDSSAGLIQASLNFL
jgi:hypothetical protein